MELHGQLALATGGAAGIGAAIARLANDGADGSFGAAGTVGARIPYVTTSTYVHDWSVGDLLIWDNLMLQYPRLPFASNGPRTLRRTPIV